MAFTQFEELANSPILDFAPDHSSATRMAKIPWSAVPDFLEFLFPAAGLGIPRTLPGYPWLFARAVHVEPFVGDDEKITSPDLDPSVDLDYDTLNAYGNARVTIQYEAPSPGTEDPGDDPVVLSHRWSVGGEFLSVPHSGMEWVDGSPVGEDVTFGLLIPTIEHQMTWARVVSPPFEVIRDRIGSVNNAVLNFKTGTIYKETLLFLSAELRRDVLVSGDLAWEVGYRFSERRVPLDLIPGACCLAGDCTEVMSPDDCDNPSADFYAEARCTQVTCGSTSTDDWPIPVVGGWNHFFRSEEAVQAVASSQSDTGFLIPGRPPMATWMRLRTKPVLNNGGTLIGGLQPLYQPKSFAELFVEA